MSSQAMRMAPISAAQPSAPAASADTSERVYTARLHTSLEAVKPLWLEWQANGICTAHQHYAWAEGIATRLMPKSAELLVVEVSDAATGEPKMLVPLMRRRAYRHYVVEWLSCGVCDYSAPLLADASPWTRQGAEAAWAAVCSVLPPVDRIHIAGIPQQVFGVANPLALLSATRDSIQVTSGLVLHGDPEGLIKRICRPSFAKDFRKHCRRFEQLGGLSLVEADTPALTEELFGTLLELRLKRFRELARFDLLTRQSAVDFYLNAALQGLSDGSVRLFGLRVGQAWLASMLVLARKGTLHGILLAIDKDAVANVSPGLTTIGKLMMWGRERGFDYFDLSVGGQGYKEHIGAANSVLSEICEPMTLRGWGANAAILYRSRAERYVRLRPRLLKAVQSVARGLRRLKD
ncbi:GNAT family N-acetyltransferase [Mesorhizobium sophorae]|uniref:GNAT family N-acetyltransferase n=1 Tax=Mesorhizobium sophorae TaxID=1300294 RepID=UPI000BA39D5A|nr:GNAT family N-acetyltransferase [Mesorhizobium sophorae]